MDECATCVGFRAILVDASPPYQLVPAGTSWSILFTHTIGAFGHSAGTVPVSQEIPPNQPIGWIGRSIPIDRYRSMMTDPARVPPPSGVPTSRGCPARVPGGARRQHATGRPREETSSSWCELRTRTRERDVSRRRRASGDVASDDDEG